MSDSVGRPKKIETLIINDNPEAPSLLNPTTGQILLTNRVGKRIIELADGNRDVEAIAEQVSREFRGAQSSDVVRHTESFLAESARKGIVTWTA
jgi:hypothetical protein